MQANLKFKLPEEDREFRQAINSEKMYIVLWEMDQWLRGNIKHAPDDMSEDTYKTFEKCREMLNELMINHDLSFN